MKQKPKKGRDGFSHEKTFMVLFVIASLVFVGMFQLANADPSGASITYNDSGSGTTYTPGNRTDDGGTINTLVFDVVQQNTKWKAYLGNVSGVLTLDDSNGNTIYQWAMTAAQITGELYVARTDSVSWSGINCSNTTLIESEDTALGFSGSEVDTINSTFNETTHQSIVVAGVTIPSDQCRSTATYVNDSKQVQATADFQEILLGSGTDMIYVSPLNQGTSGYDVNQTVDFQVLVADDVTTAITTYYFFVEIG